MTQDRPPLPDLQTLVAVADASLHPWVRERVPEPDRTAALAEEIDFPLNIAARDLGYARQFAAVAPQIGAPVESYLDRWLSIGRDGHVLAGPRYLGRDPNLPFVGISGSDRPIVAADRDALVDLAHTHFAPFAPKFVLLQSADPVQDWPGCTTERRTVVGALGELRSVATDRRVTAVPRRDVEMYDAYKAVYDRDLAADPGRARMATPEDRDDLAEIAGNGLLFDIRVEGEWAGVIAAELDARRGIPGAIVKELVLEQRFRRSGIGHQLSILLARVVPLDDRELLVGTIHAGNVGAYRAALRAGRVDVGGEIVIPIR
jgi:GNAT superfamily N-acetyltransferase